MPKYDDNFMAELVARNDIETVVSQYVTLKRAGRHLKGLCPFHNEKTPSFTVFPDTNSYFCFGCQSGGDVVSFVKNIENISYAEAIKLLAERSGISLPEDNFDSGLSERKRKIYEANREAAKYFFGMLFTALGKSCLEYYFKRGLDKNAIKKFGLGFAPDSWDSLVKYMKGKGFSELELKEADLVKSGQNGRVYDNFRNRAMFPIIDVRGNVVAFSGRTLSGEDKRKYVNTGETLVYKKGNEIFGLNFAKKTKAENLILVEGNMDVVTCHSVGFDNVVAALGTALTERQAKELSSYRSEIVLCLDNDEAGKNAIKKDIATFFNVPVNIKVAVLKGGKDPDEIIKNHGGAYFAELIKKSLSVTEFELLNALSKFDLGDLSDKAEFGDSAAEIISKIKNPVEKELYAGKIAETLGVSKEAVLNQAEEKAKKNAKKQRNKEFKSSREVISRPTKGIFKINPDRAKYLKAAISEETVIAILARCPEELNKSLADLNPEAFITDFNRRVYSYMLKKIKENGRFSLTDLIGGFNENEISEVSRIFTSIKEILPSNYENCLKDCIKTLYDEKQKMIDKPVLQMDDNEFRNLFKNFDN